MSEARGREAPPGLQVPTLRAGARASTPTSLPWQSSAPEHSHLLARSRCFSVLFSHNTPHRMAYFLAHKQTSGMRRLMLLSHSRVQLLSSPALELSSLGTPAFPLLRASQISLWSGSFGMSGLLSFHSFIYIPIHSFIHPTNIYWVFHARHWRCNQIRHCQQVIRLMPGPFTLVVPRI